MLRMVAVIFFVMLAGAGCSDSKNPVREYGSNLTGAVKNAEKARVIADLVAIKAELMRYKAEQGEYPLSLQALNLKDIHADQYTYDPATGAVAVAP